jgi:tetratricopeptide (TPR) repeat protein
MNMSFRNLVRQRLRSLQSDNGETLFEQVCAEIARRRIHRNVKMSSFVAGHGDKGRDFENVPGYDPLLVGLRGQKDGLKPDDAIVGACTLGRSDPESKIRADVQTIHNKGPKPKAIYYFCETDFPTALQIDLSRWSEQTYGTNLYIITGNTLSEWLAEVDLTLPLKRLGLAAPPIPRCVLPPIDTEGFVGRCSEVEFLTKALIDGDTPIGGRIIGLFGSPGVGKSGLAVHFARLNLDRFPDGVIGVDLRGVDDPLDALARIAVALGEPLTGDEQGCPPHQIAQSRLAHRQCLILLDNLEYGSTLKQIRPGGRAALLITCRDQEVLAQFAVPAEHRRFVEKLPRTEAIAYFQSALGNDVHTSDELDALANTLRDLPLALRIGSRRVMEDPIVGGRIERFIARLRSPARIGELSVSGETDLDLVRLFDLSLERLSVAEGHAFACLSVCTAKGFGVRAAAAAIGCSDPLPLIARFARLSLLEVDQATSRFRFHALVDDYASHLAERWGLTLAARNRHAQAMANLLRENANMQGIDLVELLVDQEDIRHGLEYFVDAADTGHIDLLLLQGLTRLVEQTALGAWHSSLLVRLRGRLSLDSQAWLSAVLLLQQGKRDLALGKLKDARAAFEQSLEIDRTLNNQRGEAMILNSLGGVLRDLGQLTEARHAFERSLEIGRVYNNPLHEAMVLNSLGGVLRDLGKFEEAITTFERSLEIGRTLNDPRHEAMALNSLGWALCNLERLEDSLAAFRRSLEIRRILNDEHGQSIALNGLGRVLRDLGQLDEAVTVFEQSLKIGRALNDQRHEAIVLNGLGGVLRDLGQLSEARTVLEQSLKIGRTLNDQRHEMIVLNGLGGVLRDLGQLGEARTTFDQALEINRTLNDQRHEAIVLNGLGGVLRDLGQLDEARTAFEQALEINHTLNNRRYEAIVLNGLGGVLRDLGQLDEARTAFEQSLNISRILNDQLHEARTCNSLGWLYRELGDPSKALDFLDASRAMVKDAGDPTPAPAFFKSELKMLRKWSRQLASGTHTLAAYHLAMEKRRASSKDWYGAIIHMQNNLALNNDGAERCERAERLAYACFHARRLSNAIDTYHAALEMGPISPVGYAHLGRALHLAGGDLTEAEDHLRRACQLQPDNAWAQAWLGLLLAEKGRIAEAEVHVRQALLGNERHPILLYYLAQVLARFPDNRRDKLLESLDACTKASATDRPVFGQRALAEELLRRLGYPDADTLD